MAEGTGNWPSAEFAVSTILKGESYANVRLHFIVRTAAILSIVALIAAAGIWMLLLRPPMYRYVLTDASGAVVPIIPPTQRNQSDEFVVQWSIDAVTRLFSIDFANYRSQLQDAQKNLTAVGWRDFQKLMEDSGNFGSIKGNMYVSSAVPAGPGRVVKADMHPGLGRFAWRIEFPMLIHFRSGTMNADGQYKTASREVGVTIVVIRQPEYLNQSGLGIREIILR